MINTLYYFIERHKIILYLSYITWESEDRAENMKETGKEGTKLELFC